MRMNFRARVVVAGLLAICAALAGGGTPAQAAAVPQADANHVKAVYNGSVIPIRVYQNYVTGTSVSLGVYKWTNKAPLNWTQAGGLYLEQGYCAQRFTSLTGGTGTWTRAGGDFAALASVKSWVLAGDFYVKIVKYKAASTTSCV